MESQSSQIRDLEDEVMKYYKMKEKIGYILIEQERLEYEKQKFLYSES